MSVSEPCVANVVEIGARALTLLGPLLLAVVLGSGAGTGRQMGCASSPFTHRANGWPTVPDVRLARAADRSRTGL